jgi:hypothetical protein
MPTVDASVIEMLGQLACLHGVLPEGAPPSSIISDIVASSLDHEMEQLARRHGCVCTRYADDIGLSTDSGQFPRALANVECAGSRQVTLGPGLERLVQRLGFSINHGKTVLTGPRSSHRFVGVVIRDRLDVPRRFARTLERMIQVADVHGLGTEVRSRRGRSAALGEVLGGMIEHVGVVRGKDSRSYRRLRTRYEDLRAASEVS